MKLFLHCYTCSTLLCLRTSSRSYAYSTSQSFGLTVGCKNTRSISSTKLSLKKEHDGDDNGALSDGLKNNHRNRTRYTIDEDTCPSLDDKSLKKVVRRHIESLETYTLNKPIAAHTKEAFEVAQEFISKVLESHATIKNKIILDSGCGTARSTVLLAKKYPDCIVIGVDRSMARLNRNVIFRKGNEKCGQSDDIDESNIIAQSFPEEPNLLIVRAELADFWRCAVDAEWSLVKHYILYPNPYPKNSRLKSRWYGHPSFPFILKLGGDITVRSNWEDYLNQFSTAVVAADEVLSELTSNSGPPATNFARKYIDSAKNGPSYLSPQKIALTNFEQKYFDCGEQTFELILSDISLKDYIRESTR